MGLIDSKTNNHFAQLLKKYKVVRTIPETNITYLEDLNQDGQDCLCRQINVNDKTIFQDFIKQIEEKKKILDNPHVVKLTEYMIGQEKEYCGSYHKIYILFEYPHRTIEEEVHERITQRSRFDEKQLWSIIASCILGMSFLQSNSINHQAISSKNILVDNKGSVKVADPFCTLEASNYSKMLLKNKPAHIYLSPELCKCLDNAETVPGSEIDPYRSDVFTFGMVILQISLLKYLDDCYREDNTKIDWDTIKYYLDQVEQSYGTQLKQFIEKLVSDTGKRPDWLELKLHMKDDGKSSKNSQLPSQNISKHSHKHSQVLPSIQPQSQPQPVVYTNVVVTNNQPYSVPQSSHHNYLHLGGIPHEYRPTNHIVSGQASPKHAPIDYTGTRPPVYINQPPVGHISNVTTNSSAFAQITPLQGSNINFVRPVLGTRPADSYITHTKIDENLVEVSDDQDQLQTNQGDSTNVTNMRNNYPNHNITLNSHTQPIASANNSIPQGPYAPIVDTRYNVIPSPSHTANVSYHTSYHQTPVNLSTHSSPKNYNVNPSHQQFSSTSTQRYITNIPIRAVSHHNAQFTMPISNVSPNITGQSSINTYKPLDNKNLFTDYQKLGIKKSDPNITNITQSYFTKTELVQNRPVSQHQGNRNVLPQSSYNPPPPAPISDVQRVVETFSQGSRYEGQKRNGMRDGKGKFYYQDGGLYDGEWKENKMCGKGKLFYQSGKIAYDGNWQNDQFTGFGILYNQEPQELNEPYNYNNFNDMQEVWTKYEGYFVDDKKQGDGKLFFSNGEYHDGKFDDDVVNGRGVFYKMDGGKVKGIWKDNQLVQIIK